MVYGSETWAMNVEQSVRLERTEMKVVRWMCGVSLMDERNRLRWLGHVLRKDDDWVKKCMSRSEGC